ncbi:hypothetical protein Sjap_024199 [Stephania japonica]|uniref:Uncharacterized protein n=1 Tax=Stephania japonica TaxID=461633 RepID=A0AAP0EHR4_9MAGN
MRSDGVGISMRKRAKTVRFNVGKIHKGSKGNEAGTSTLIPSETEPDVHQADLTFEATDDSGLSTGGDDENERVVVELEEDLDSHSDEYESIDSLVIRGGQEGVGTDKLVDERVLDSLVLEEIVAAETEGISLSMNSQAELGLSLLSFTPAESEAVAAPTSSSPLEEIHLEDRDVSIDLGTTDMEGSSLPPAQFLSQCGLQVTRHPRRQEEISAARPSRERERLHSGVDYSKHDSREILCMQRISASTAPYNLYRRPREKQCEGEEESVWEIERGPAMVTATATAKAAV